MNSRDILLRGRISPILFVALCVPFALTHASAGPVGALNTFTNGSVADANEVNANFAAVETAVNDNDTRIDANDGRITALEGALPIRIVLVSPVPGDALASAARIRAAFAAITDNAADNPYLVRLEPGVYDLAADGLLMKPYVDLAGSGRHNTTLIGTSPIWPAARNEVRDLGIRSTGNIAVQCVADTESQFHNVSIEGALVAFMVLWGAKLEVTHVACEVGVGLQIMDDSTCIARDSSFVATVGPGGHWGALVNETSSLTARNCVFRASGGGAGPLTRSLFAANTTTVRCAGCEFGEGDPEGDVNALKLVNCYDGNFDPIPNQ